VNVSIYRAPTCLRNFRPQQPKLSTKTKDTDLDKMNSSDVPIGAIRTRCWYPGCVDLAWPSIQHRNAHLSVDHRNNTGYRCPFVECDNGRGWTIPIQFRYLEHLKTKHGKVDPLDRCPYPGCTNLDSMTQEALKQHGTDTHKSSVTNTFDCPVEGCVPGHEGRKYAKWLGLLDHLKLYHNSGCAYVIQPRRYQPLNSSLVGQISEEPTNDTSGEPSSHRPKRSQLDATDAQGGGTSRTQRSFSSPASDLGKTQAQITHGTATDSSVSRPPQPKQMQISTLCDTVPESSGPQPQPRQMRISTICDTVPESSVSPPQQPPTSYPPYDQLNESGRDPRGGLQQSSVSAPRGDRSSGSEAEPPRKKATGKGKGRAVDHDDKEAPRRR